MPNKKRSPDAHILASHTNPDGKGVFQKPVIEAVLWCATDDTQPRVHQLLSRREQQELTSIATVVELERNSGPLFMAGEKAEYLYSVDWGIVRVLKDIASGERQIVSFMFPGDLLGLAEVGRYSNTVEPVTSCRLYRYPVKTLERLLARDPILDMHLLLKACHELRSAQRILSVVAREQSCDRLASFIALLMRHESLYDRRLEQLLFPMTRFDIADYLAMSPETLARCLRRLEEQNKLRRIGPRRIHIIDTAFFSGFSGAL